MKSFIRSVVLTYALLWGCAWVALAHGPFLLPELPAHPVRVRPCGSDLDCHTKNPGLCLDSEPYCFAGAK